MFKKNGLEKVWTEYMLENREREDLVQLANDATMDDFFRDRAIQIMWCYDKSKLSFFVHCSNMSDGVVFYVDDLYYPSDKLDLITKIVMENMPKIAGKEKYTRAYFYYNQNIVYLLPRLDFAKQQELFSLFQINDVRSFSGIDEASGYNPLRELLYSKNIDQRIKNMAMDRLHSVIRDEFAGKSKPREKHEDAFNCLVHILELMTYGDDADVKSDFFEKEMEFLLTIDNGKPVTGTSSSFVKMWNLIKKSEVRRDMVKRHLFNKDGEFMIYSHEHEKTMLEAAEEFPEIKEFLDIKIKEFYAREAENEKYKDTEKAKKEKMLNKMKKN